MKNIESWRWSQIVLLLAVPALLIVIIAGLVSRIVPVPFNSALSPTSINAVAPAGFTTVFAVAENVALAIKNYQHQLFLIIGLMVIGSIGFLYGLALLIYTWLAPVKFRREILAVAIGGFNLIFVGIGGLNITNDTDGYLVGDCARLQGRYDSRQYQIAEGRVHVSHLEPTNGHSQGDVIQVGNASLEVSYYVSTCGYKQSIAHDGVLTEGTYARVYYTDYYPNYPSILRIDIKNP